MSEKLPNMLENTIQKIREMVDVNSVIGNPITTPDGVTIIPVSKVSVGFGGGGSDFSGKSLTSTELPFGGGVGGGVKVNPSTSERYGRIPSDSICRSSISCSLAESTVCESPSVAHARNVSSASAARCESRLQAR